MINWNLIFFLFLISTVTDDSKQITVVIRHCALKPFHLFASCICKLKAKPNGVPVIYDAVDVATLPRELGEFASIDSFSI